jgi:predicted ester cyclase
VSNSPAIALTSSPLIATAERFMQVVWNGGNPQAVFGMVTDDYVDHAYTPGDAHGHAAMVEQFNGAFSQGTHEIADAVANSDTVILRLWVRARHTGTFRGVPPTGAIIEAKQYRTFRIRDNQIAEHWSLFDTMALMQQIGALPDNGIACNRP